MKQLFNYPSFLNSIIYVLLIGQLWVNTFSYCSWMVDSEWELIELCGSEDNESEEEDKKEEKDDKIQLNLDASSLYDLSLIANIFYLECIPSLHHPEITTPPPELSLSIS